MKKFLICAAFLAVSSTAQAQTYHVDGFTIHVPRNCSSTSCVSLHTPGYGDYYGGKRVRSATSKKAKSTKIASKGEKAKDGDPATPPAAQTPVPAPPPTQASEAARAPDTPPAAEAPPAAK